MNSRSIQSVDDNPSKSHVAIAGKFFHIDGRKWLLKGLTFGPFAPNSHGEFLPERDRLRMDLAKARDLGANCLRVYHKPPVEFLDLALSHGLRTFVDVPWDKHRCFFEDWSAMQEARKRVADTARELGNHPGLFALSVVNEISSDIVRFYGQKRVAKFLDELLDSAKQAAPSCLTTFANFPSTEFLQPAGCDFLCFNVYLEQPDRLGQYLDRLQHLAGSRPLILGEFGCDSIRHGEAQQAEAIEQHVSRVFHHGLAGSFVFSYSDDWYTGGHQISDWAFGVTRADRTDKPAAIALSQAWARAPRVEPAKTPRVSVVVCSYNGAATLCECLESLTKLNYPDYEVILVDDGSRDHTQQIAADFPSVRNIRQENKGLSVARNVGAQAATGEIVAYTDSDCVADADWLHYLIDAIQRQNVESIGGPNIPPSSDCWVAHCVAASPGGPSHVMLNDQLAEHVPGCNMAFRRDILLKLGGFDAQFRQAGDDVDICWRLLDAGYKIGFASSAVVWHHRRNTVKAFLKQQKGYGRSEAMLLYKHPERFNDRGCSRWRGVIYGEGAVGLPMAKPAVFHGRYGTGLFQTIYHRNEYSWIAYFTLLEWHLIASLPLVIGLFAPKLLIVSAVMWVLTLFAAAKATYDGPLNASAPMWCRPLVFALHILQPMIRSLHRYAYRLGRKSIPKASEICKSGGIQLKRISLAARDAYWMSTQGRCRDELLKAVESAAGDIGWQGRFHEQWERWDVKLLGGRWHNINVYTATEHLGSNKCFTRARCVVELTRLARVLNPVIFVLTALSIVEWRWMGLIPAGTAIVLWGSIISSSRHRCFKAMSHLLAVAGRNAKMDSFESDREVPQTKKVVAPRKAIGDLLTPPVVVARENQSTTALLVIRP